MELNITKPTKFFEGFSSFGRCGKEAIDLQHNIFHIHSELIKSMLHCVVHNVGMAVSLQQIFLFLLQVGEDRFVLSALNAVSWTNVKPNFQATALWEPQSQQQTHLHFPWNPAFCWWPRILDLNIEQQGGTSSCCLYLVHLSQWKMGGVYLM